MYCAKDMGHRRRSDSFDLLIGGCWLELRCLVVRPQIGNSIVRMCGRVGVNEGVGLEDVELTGAYTSSSQHRYCPMQADCGYLYSHEPRECKDLFGNFWICQTKLLLALAAYHALLI